MNVDFEISSVDKIKKNVHKEYPFLCKTWLLFLYLSVMRMKSLNKTSLEMRKQDL